MIYSTIIGDPILFWLLRITLLVIFIYTGSKITYKYKEQNKIYWKIATPLIIFYTLNEGLRWNRGVDYYHYYQDLTGELFKDTTDFLYLQWLNLFKLTNLPFWCGFLFYSLILIASYLFLIRLFQETAIWTLPLFFLSTVRFSENLIRQYIAITFIILAIYFLIKRRDRYVILFCLMSILIHFSAIVPSFILFAIGYFHFDKTLKTPFIPLLLFSFFYFAWDNSYFSYITDFLGSLSSSDENLDNYLAGADIWFSEEGSLSNKHGENITSSYSLIYMVVKYFIYAYAILKGFYLVKKDIKYRLIYWLSYIAIIFDTIRGDIEMYLRFYVWFSFLVPILFGALLIRPNEEESILKRIFRYAFIIVIVFYFGKSYIWTPMTTIDLVGYAYVWDAF